MSGTDAAPLATPIETARRRRTHRLAVAGGWLAVIAAYWIWSSASGVGPADLAVDIVEFVQGSAWGPVLLAAVYLIRPLLLFSAAILTVAAGHLFGIALGLVVVVLAANASAMIAYGVGRWFGAGMSTTDPAGSRISRYISRMRARSFETTATLRLLFLPYDLVSYAAGIWRINPLGFLAGTAVGSLPGTVAFVAFGASVERFDGGVPSIDTRSVVISLGALAVSLVIARVVRRRDVA